MSSNRSLVLRSAVGAVLSLSAVQFAPAMAAADDAPIAVVLEEITVTAEKREAKLQEVAIAVSAYTGEVRDIVGISTIEDFAAFTPGLQYNSADRISIRGIGRFTNSLGSDPGVATYNDGIYTASTSESNKSTLFVERVEMLRGPQGTLYGRNSIGGAINVISKRPSRDGFAGEVRVSGGNYGALSVGASISAPMSDSFRFRLTAQKDSRSQGYFQNDVGADRYRADSLLAELQIEADFGEHVNWWLKYSRADWGKKNSLYSLNNVQIDEYFHGSLFPTGSLVPNPQFLAYTLGQRNPGAQDHYTIREDMDSSASLDNNNSIATQLTVDLGGSVLKYYGGWQKFEYTQIGDFDGTGLQGSTTLFGTFVTPYFPQESVHFGNNISFYSNELDWSTTGSDRYDFIAGIYQYHESHENPVTLELPGHAAQINAPFYPSGLGLIPSAIPAPANSNAEFYNSQGFLKVDSYAAFSQYDLKLTDTWSMTVGARYSQDKKVGDESLRMILFLPTAVTANPLTSGTGNAAIDVTPLVNTRHLEGKWNAVSGKFGLSFTPSDNVLTYLDYSRGFKSGGFNLGTIIPVAEVDSETLDAIELGVKTNPTSTLQINSALFYYKYDNLQVPFAQFRNGISTTTFVNTDATSMGLELETTWAPIESLSFLLNYSYLKTEIARGCSYTNATTYSDCYYDPADTAAVAPGAQPVGLDAQGNRVQDLKGNKLPQAPQNKLSFHTNYRLMFDPGSLTFSASYIWQDKTNYSMYNNPAYETPAFGITNFRALWQGSNDKYTIIAYLNNAFDKEGYNGAAVSSQSFGANRTWYLLPPRVVGAELQVRF